MKNLIAQRPNVVPTGIGHSGTDIDLTILQDAGAMTKSDVDDDQPQFEAPMLYDDVADELLDTSDAEGLTTGNTSTTPLHVTDDISPPAVKRKALLESDRESSPDLRTPARSGSSKPATVKPRATKKTKLMEEFSVAAQAEEVTRQKEINLARVKVEAATRLKVEAGKVNLEAKLELEKQRMEERSEKRLVKKELKLQQMKLKHEFRMAQLHAQNGHRRLDMSMLAAGGGSHVAGTSSSVSSSSVSMFDEYRGADYQYPASTSTSDMRQDLDEFLYNRHLPTLPAPSQHEDEHNNEFRFENA